MSMSLAVFGSLKAIVNYLINPPNSLNPPRPGVGIAIIVLFAILLLLIALAYFRLLSIVTFNPGYVPRGLQWYAQQEHNARVGKRNGCIRAKRRDQKDEEKAQGHSHRYDMNGEHGEHIYNGTLSTPTPTEPTSSLQDFIKRDMFVCQGDGRPVWCSKCLNWKPDRAHHCSEIDRCVRKMDHFCPWYVEEEVEAMKLRIVLFCSPVLDTILTIHRVGGVVSETSFKFFLLFAAWTAIFCIFNLIVVAYFLAEHKSEVSSISFSCCSLFNCASQGFVAFRNQQGKTRR